MPYAMDCRYGDFWDDLSAAIPSNTVVGHAASGDWGGAVAGAVQYVGGLATGKVPSAPSTTPAVPQHAASPASFIAQNQTVLLLVAAGLVAVLVLRKKRG